ncbi:MAG: UDP-N-acetylmuramoyl-tripeptide--D-alanyl-D-alanine ligase [Deltaproteobacteria bacterium]|nr:UDP-N-acetylmuramoyl-tripeptide--D-alanyl-D-alanine ligase [Deltaproteobacteria bacterium]
MKLDGRTLADLSGGVLVADGPAGPVATDTRALSPNAWFVALKGLHHDGHAFLAAAHDAGCAGAVVSADPPEGWDRGLVRVPDTLRALQDVATGVRRRFGGPVVGITGSVGKTTTRALAALALQVSGRVHATAGNLNNHVGLPLTILAAPPDATVWVLEMGLSAPGEIRRLQEIAAPNVRLVTCVAAAHLEGLGSVEGVARAKGELFDTARPGDVVCVNTDDPRVVALPVPGRVRVLRYGTSRGCDVRLIRATPTAEGGTSWVVEAAGRVLSGVLPAPGLHMARNLVAAVALTVAVGASLDGVPEALARYEPVGDRMRLERGPGGLTFLNDAYNANPESMAAALDTLATLPASRRVALLGDMLELGPQETAFHRQVLDRALAAGLSLVGLCGPRMVAAAAELPPRLDLVVAPDPEGLARAVADRLAPGDLVLVKASRQVRMERALHVLATLLGSGPEA